MTTTASNSIDRKLIKEGVSMSQYVFTSSGERCESTWETYEEAYEDLVKSNAWGVVLKHKPYSFDDDEIPEEIKVFEFMPHLKP